MNSQANQFAHIGMRLRQIREGVGNANQKDWCSANGFNPTQYNNWERGSRRIPIEHAMTLVQRYGLTLDFIYRGRIDGVAQNALKSLSGQSASNAATSSKDTSS